MTLRKVLDYVPSRSMVGWKGRAYFEALNKRLNREVLVEVPMAKPARDEAVLVVPQEDWDEAQAARERQLVQEAELEQTHQELDNVRSRSQELENEVDELRARLAGMKTEVAEKKKVALQLVGVRRPAPPPSTPSGWEIVPEEATPAPAEAPPPATDLATVEAIERVEAEIRKIEQELSSLAEQEQTLKERSTTAEEPYRHEGFTLYRRKVGKGDNERDFYFFTRTTPETGEPSELPAGYEVAVNPKTGTPFLQKPGERPAKAAAPKKRLKRKKK